MSRRARTVAVLLAGVVFAAWPARAPATPFADVPANHWAYQAIASLAADGLVDGAPDAGFNGDRPLTRYEMAAIVARVIARLQADGARSASKTDLDKLQKLIDALKDELDALGVRVTSLEDALGALDRRTRTAQSIAVHGTVLAQGSFRSNPSAPRSVGNATGIDPFVTAYETTPDNNDPLDAQLAPATLLRTDARFDFVYTVNPNLTVSVPVHALAGGPPAGTGQLTLSPDLIVDIAQAGAITNLTLRAAQLDNLASSRLGLAYRAPDAAQQSAFQNATQPFPRGFEIGGILSGLTAFQFSLAQVDQTLLNTQTAFPGGYLTNVVPPQGGYVQIGSVPATDTFAAGGSPLAGVYLSKKAVAGTVTIVAYSTLAGPAPAPAFSYLDALNEVVFAQPLPPGAHVSIQYSGLGYTNNALAQRYQLGLRVNTLIPGLPGGEAGLTYHRLWDAQLPRAGDPGATDLGVNAYPAGGTGAGLVSDEVFGIDIALPLPFGRRTDPYARPAFFGEVAGSRFSPDAPAVGARGATAGVAGLRLTFGPAQATLQLQSVGAGFLAGAPARFFGSAPATWANYQGDVLPQFAGFANTQAINAAFDAAVNAAGPGHSATAANPALTFLYPIFNPFVAGGPDNYSAFAPNTTGPSLTVLSPLRFGGVTVAARFFMQHLTQVQADAGATGTFGPQFPTAVRATYDKFEAGGTLPVPAFGRTVDINLAGTLERLRRNDPAGYPYVPFDPAIAAYDAAALANFSAAGGTVDPVSGKLTGAGNAAVRFAPNNVNITHSTLAAGASLPLTPDVVLHTRYSDQRFTGSYGSLQQNVNSTKDQIDVGLTYAVPKTASTVGLSFRSSTYRDGSLASYNLNQSREDVNFTIRF